MPPESLQDFDARKDSFFESILNQNKVPIVGILIGLIFLGGGFFLYKEGAFESGEKVEVISANEPSLQPEAEMVVEIAGGVQKPGVYTLPQNSRVEELLIVAGGLSVDADRQWVQKYVNRAAKLVDGQKLFIYKVGEHLESTSANNNVGIKMDQGVLGGSSMGGVNINSASLQELDSLPGIGPVYGQKIIEHRPYSNTTELLSKGVLKEGVYEKIKTSISVY